MEINLLVDIGSTYTKLVAVDLIGEKVIGFAQAPTTVEDDVTIGLKAALGKLFAECRIPTELIKRRLACSSAAGGLKIIAVGLVPELTVTAARQAALGAGAKVIKAYGYELTNDDREEIEKAGADILLLAGGTDGGNKDYLLHNARVLAHSQFSAPILFAGNRAAKDEVKSILAKEGKTVRATENVMPEMRRLHVDPAREEIRNIFMERIVQAKGIDKARALVDNILMPTPLAVLKGARLLADGVEGEAGIGEVVVIDIGGATTDIHSIAQGAPVREDVIVKGLPEPYAKRTVEGDLGIRYNSSTILQLAGKEKLLGNIGKEVPDIEGVIERLSHTVSLLPRNQQEQAIDVGLARTAAEIAMQRHAGRIDQFYSLTGWISIQQGKDLTQVRHVIGTGGIFASLKEVGEIKKILSGLLFDLQNPGSLKPKAPLLYHDARYTLFAMGLLADITPKKALRIMKNYLKPLPG